MKPALKYSGDRFYNNLSIAVLLLLSAAALAHPQAQPPGGSHMNLSSTGFTNGGVIPKKFTCDGADVSPQLSWTDAPASIKTFALLTDDPDAPVGNWNHWTMWNVPASAKGLPEGVPKEPRLADGSQQGLNDFHKPGYNGPCPPQGKPHRYYFKLFALDASLDLNPTATKKDIEGAMKGHIQAQAEWMGRYER